MLDDTNAGEDWLADATWRGDAASYDYSQDYGLECPECRETWTMSLDDTDWACHWCGTQFHYRHSSGRYGNAQYQGYSAYSGLTE